MAKATLPPPNLAQQNSPSPKAGISESPYVVPPSGYAVLAEPAESATILESSSPQFVFRKPRTIAEIRGDETLFILTEQVRTAFVNAHKLGYSGIDFLKVVSAEARPYIEEEWRAGYATPEVGLSNLLSAEGGCVDVAQAAKLYAKPNGVRRQTIWDKINKGELIAYQTGTDRWLLPVWQFRPEGGVLKGLPAVLKSIREKLPQASPLFPFTFFLQPDPVTGGLTPLAALRAGDETSVLRAVAGFQG